MLFSLFLSLDWCYLLNDLDVFSIRKWFVTHVFAVVGFVFETDSISISQLTRHDISPSFPFSCCLLCFPFFFYALGRTPNDSLFDNFRLCLPSNNCCYYRLAFSMETSNLLTGQTSYLDIGSREDGGQWLTTSMYQFSSQQDEHHELRQVKIVWGLATVSRRFALGNMMDERNKSE